MDFKKIPVSCHPPYTWLWNDTVDDNETARRIDRMYDCGIRAYYALGEPEQFRPNLRRTYLKPEYLSREYLDRVYFAYDYAKKKGMVTWLYNEGGFPSGMACGKIRKMRPELAFKNVKKQDVSLSASVPYCVPERFIAAFCGEKRIFGGEVFEKDVTVTQFVWEDGNLSTTSMRTDIAERENTDIFLSLTHEAFKKRFGDVLGNDITMMFDDEAAMGTWTRGLDVIFKEKYGYDLCDFLPYVLPGEKPVTREQCRARSDYAMLCGELILNNYFIPMREWLERNGMKSTGHLGGENKSDFVYTSRYGNCMDILRSYHVPGVDVIWSQITYPDPKTGKCCREGYEFFPLLASSAARQQGHSDCVSESFAVYGAQIVPEEMRYIINYQAVRGVARYNFMSMSYNRTDVRCLQCRPNFIDDNPGMDCLGALNDYTARITYIILNSKADITAALYYPQRSICAGGEYGENAAADFEKIGHMLEKEGVSFDIIDEAFVKSAKIENGILVGEHVEYKNVFVPQGEFEPDCVKEMLSRLPLPRKEPCIKRKNTYIMARKMYFENGEEAYFICNTDGKTVKEKVEIYSEKTPYTLDVADGEIYRMPFERSGNSLSVEISLMRGEAIVILLSDKTLSDKSIPETVFCTEITDFESYISRKYTIDDEKGPEYLFVKQENSVKGLYEWDRDFSGEVTYSAVIPKIEEGEYILELGDVRHYAKVYVNGIKAGEVIMPPYRLAVSLKSGDVLKTEVQNTPSNVTRRAEYFEKCDIKDVGPYHVNMKKAEENAPCGGLIGPVKLYKIKK